MPLRYATTIPDTAANVAATIGTISTMENHPLEEAVAKIN
jgi:hypothetical protein